MTISSYSSFKVVGIACVARVRRSKGRYEEKRKRRVVEVLWVEEEYGI